MLAPLVDYLRRQCQTTVYKLSGHLRRLPALPGKPVLEVLERNRRDLLEAQAT